MSGYYQFDEKKLKQRYYVMKSPSTFKCKKCAHYYRTMTGGGGYNPAPYCHLYEDTGVRPNALTQECFKARAKRRKV